MTGNARRSGPPWSVDLLADLHAGALDPRTEAELRPLVENDPEAQAILAALDATLDDLHDLPPIPMPRHVAERIDAALAEEARPSAPVIDFAQAKARRAKRLGWGAGLLAAAAVAVGVAVMTIPRDTTAGDGGLAQEDTTQNAPVTGSAQPPGGADLPAVRGENFGPVVGDVLKAQNYGPLENQEKLADCLRGANITAGKPLGVSPITLDDKPAVMAILPAGAPGAYRIVVVDPRTCGPDNPDGVLANSTIEP
ncbi:hypothetical protein FHX81_4361 [Saccharothrix saharensis]|uniref:Anti-sigma-M factor RsmA n=1 Tax=Saccharothrix saharensis TaxID=571190 RepID=A0A543JGR1_9PSEU|nr:hypothetical protein [Saccharothrix saharensis]TQM81971.1 hypothetical protein FHX81_4361 [Saccharothrix saharensis]